MIAIIDYGMGNIHSVRKALEIYGAKVIVTNSAKVISSADKIVLPGVGAFDDAMSELERRGLVSVLKEQIKKNKPFLGICLGMQLLFEKSEEARKKAGLGILRGSVKKFAMKNKKIPHMGWNQIKFKVQSAKCKCKLLTNIPEDAFVYFCHSYYPAPKDKFTIAATCNYGSDFTSVVAKDNIYGVQFHPEKSQEVGLRMLKNFVKLC